MRLGRWRQSAGRYARCRRYRGAFDLDAVAELGRQVIAALEHVGRAASSTLHADGINQHEGFGRDARSRGAIGRRGGLFGTFQTARSP